MQIKFPRDWASARWDRQTGESVCFCQVGGEERQMVIIEFGIVNVAEIGKAGQVGNFLARRSDLDRRWATRDRDYPGYMVLSFQKFKVAFVSSYAEAGSGHAHVLGIRATAVASDGANAPHILLMIRESPAMHLRRPPFRAAPCPRVAFRDPKPRTATKNAPEHVARHKNRTCCHRCPANHRRRRNPASYRHWPGNATAIGA